MSFCTAVNCIDGRAQLPVINYLRTRFSVEYVDSVTEPGVNRILAEHGGGERAACVLRRLEVSMDRHDSRQVAVVGHHDCAANPSGRPSQEQHVRAAVRLLRERYGHAEVIGLWVDEHHQVAEVA